MELVAVLAIGYFGFRYRDNQNPLNLTLLGASSALHILASWIFASVEIGFILTVVSIGIGYFLREIIQGLAEHFKTPQGAKMVLAVLGLVLLVCLPGLINKIIILGLLFWLISSAFKKIFSPFFPKKKKK